MPFGKEAVYKMPAHSQGRFIWDVEMCVSNEALEQLLRDTEFPVPGALREVFVHSDRCRLSPAWAEQLCLPPSQALSRLLGCHCVFCQ